MIGDVSAVMDEASGRPYPTTAQIALAQADVVADNIEATLKNQPLTDFVYQSKGTVASIGNNNAIGNAFGKNFKGFIASKNEKRYC